MCNQVVDPTPQVGQPDETEGLTDAEFLAGMRQSFLHLVDLIERKCGNQPRTAEIRKWYTNRQGDG